MKEVSLAVAGFVPSFCQKWWSKTSMNLKGESGIAERSALEISASQL